MKRSLLVLLCLGAVLAAATAASGRPTDIPACEELLTTHQAELAMGEPHAVVLHRSVQGSTRLCVYGGGSKGPIARSLMVEWGPYSDYRTQSATFRSQICPVSKTACQKLTAAVRLRPDLRSFAGLIAALGQVGTARRLHSTEYDQNPAVVWLPAASLAPLDQLAWVLVYVSQSKSLLVGACTDNGTKAPDVHCALLGAGWGYNNVT
jgi:hypothetical protein